MADREALERAVASRRARELARLRDEAALAARAEREVAARRRGLDSLREALRESSRRADPAMRTWLDENLERVLHAFPRRRERSLDLPALDLGDVTPRFVHELGEGETSRAWKHYTVSIGPVLKFRWSAGSLGHAGGGVLPLAPRSWGELAEIDLSAALGKQAEWQEPDVLAAALTVTERIARGELGALVLARLRLA